MGKRSRCKHNKWCVLGAGHKEPDCSAVREKTFADERTRDKAPDQIAHVQPVDFNAIEDKEHPRKEGVQGVIF